MLVLRHPMRVALALIATMLSLAAFTPLDAHVIAIFQVLIYVGVMVFMVYTIMLIDVRDQSFTHRYSRLTVPASVGSSCCWRYSSMACCTPPISRRSLRPFPWLTAVFDRVSERILAALRIDSVLLVVAVVAAVAILQVGRRARG